MRSNKQGVTPFLGVQIYFQEVFAMKTKRKALLLSFCAVLFVAVSVLGTVAFSEIGGVGEKHIYGRQGAHHAG